MGEPKLPDDAEVIEQFRVVGIGLKHQGVRGRFVTEIRSRRSEAQAELERLRGYESNTGMYIERRVIALGEWGPADTPDPDTKEGGTTDG